MKVVEIIKILKQKEIEQIINKYKLIEDQFGYEMNFSKFRCSMLDNDEVIQLEEWTNKKCSEIIFDSDKDDWDQNTSVFGNKLKNKTYLAFVVEEENNNKFGYYFNGTITNLNSSYMKAKDSFLFSLKSNERLSGMYKFEEKDGCNGLEISNKSSDNLWHVFNGIYFKKESVKVLSKIGEQSSAFDFHGMSNIFFPNSSQGWVKFMTKRLIVIQMN